MRKENLIEIIARIDQKLEGIEEYLKKINGKIEDHEKRIRELEQVKWQALAIVSLIPIVFMILKIIKVF